MLGSVGEKITRVVELAEELYERVTELREQVRELRETTRETHDRVVAMEEELAAQRALLDAIAEVEGVDVEAVLAEVDVGDEESAEEAANDEIEPTPTDDDPSAPEDGSGATGP